jgi:5-methylcytosine-specific restriction endonuclease McrA
MTTKAYRQSHKKEIQEARIRYKEKHKEKSLEWIERNRKNKQRWRLANKEKVKAKQRKKYLRQKQGWGVSADALFIKMKHYFGDKCLRCGSSDHLEKDHVVPIALGGVNHITNLQPLCSTCNLLKSNTIADYRDPTSLKTFLLLNIVEKSDTAQSA